MYLVDCIWAWREGRNAAQERMNQKKKAEPSPAVNHRKGLAINLARHPGRRSVCNFLFMVMGCARLFWGSVQQLSKLMASRLEKYAHQFPNELHEHLADSRNTRKYQFETKHYRTSSSPSVSYQTAPPNAIRTNLLVMTWSTAFTGVLFFAADPPIMQAWSAETCFVSHARFGKKIGQAFLCVSCQVVAP